MRTDVKRRRGTRTWLLLLTSLLALTAVDLLTKDWAITNLSRQTPGNPPPVCQKREGDVIPMQRLATGNRVVVENILLLRYAENCGAAFGLLRNAPEWLRLVLFGLVTAVAGGALTLMLAQGKGGPFFVSAYPLVLSGALGNWVDRVRHGFVIDFILIDPAWFRYPVFNLADIFIAVGVGLLLLNEVRFRPGGASALGPRREAGGRGRNG